MVNSQEVYLGDSNNDRQSEMAAETGNAYISETMKGTVKIPTTNLGYIGSRDVIISGFGAISTTEMSIWPPKPEIITSLEL